MEKSLSQFDARQVANGWIINVNPTMGYVSTQYVFASLGELAEWLKEQGNLPIREILKHG